MPEENLEPKIRTVCISTEERISTQISPGNLKTGLEEFHRNGLVIVENAIGLPALDHVSERMLEDIPKNLASPRLHYNHGQAHRNISQTPPLHSEFLHEEIWANRFAAALIEHIIGPKPQLSYASSNIALPGGKGYQAVHSDYYCSHLDFPVFLEVCIFLDGASPQNGSTQVWPGTHHGYNKADHAFADRGWIKRETFVARAKICPPRQPVIPKGSICIRDLRLWHAGMPNFTDKPRIMLSFIYSPRWFGTRMRIRFPAEARQHVESWKHIDCSSVAQFVEGRLDYLEERQDLLLTEETTAGEAEYVHGHAPWIPSQEHCWSPADRKSSS